MKFTEKARKESSEFWEKSLHHPFIQELHAGTLSERNFRYYLLQDRYYLNQLRDIYSLIGQQTTYNQLKEMMVRGSERLSNKNRHCSIQFMKKQHQKSNKQWWKPLLSAHKWNMNFGKCRII